MACRGTAAPLALPCPVQFDAQPGSPCNSICDNYAGRKHQIDLTTQLLKEAAERTRLAANVVRALPLREMHILEKIFAGDLDSFALD
jgi:hypothetical protein